jgi:hypothetical protein
MGNHIAELLKEALSRKSRDKTRKDGARESDETSSEERPVKKGSSKTKVD